MLLCFPPSTLRCPHSAQLHLHNRIWQVKLPLDPGTRVDCRWRDGQMYPARVIERRPAPNGIDHEYYMHYIKCAHALLILPAAATLLNHSACNLQGMPAWAACNDHMVYGQVAFDQLAAIHSKEHSTLSATCSWALCLKAECVCLASQSAHGRVGEDGEPGPDHGRHLRLGGL